MKRRGLLRAGKSVLLGVVGGCLAWSLFVTSFPRVGAESIYQLVQLTDQLGDRVTTTGGNVPVSLQHYCQAVAFSVTTASVVVTASGGQAIYVCGMLLFEAASETAAFAAGSGSLCASSQVGIAGLPNGVVGTMPIAANGGFSIAFAIPFQVPAGLAICLFKSTTGTSSGALYVAQY